MSKKEIPRDDRYIAMQLIEYFDPDSEIVKESSKNKEHIALVKNKKLKSGTIEYFAVAYHDPGGYAIVNYSQRFDSLLGALVIYKKLKLALDNNCLEKAWKDLITNNKRKWK